MVTVLGTQKIITAFDTSSESGTVASATLISLDSPNTPTALDSNSGEATQTPILERNVLTTAVKMADSALDATREYVPIAQLVAQEVVAIEVISSASASSDTSANSDDTASPSTPISRHAISSSLAVVGNHTAGVASSTSTPEHDEAIDSQLAINNELAIDIALTTADSLEGSASNDPELAGFTSYHDNLEGPLDLWDDSDVFLNEELLAKQTYVPSWETYTVQAGDTFAVMAQQTLGLGYSEVLQLLDQMPDKNLLTRWRAGYDFDYQLDEDGQLLALRVMKSPRNGFLIERTPDSEFDVANIEKTGEPTQRLFAGTVSGSFGRSAEATGLSAAEVAQLSNLLEKKLDFRQDTRRGDRFQVLMESDLIDGQNLDSRILAVRYEGARMDLTVVRNSTDNRFYTPEGLSLDPAFDRYPFSGSYRMSSSFNLRRTHPVTGRVSPHYGTDWAMPTGTPITAPADGQIEKIGNHPLAGRFIVIRHDNGYRTRYLHLSQPLVSRGDRVSIGETIARSGNTGRSTGPHLHYEVIVNGNQVDPMRVDLPENQSLHGDALASFQRESERLLATLESGQTGTIIASTGEREPQHSGDGDDS